MRAASSPACQCGRQSLRERRQAAFARHFLILELFALVLSSENGQLDDRREWVATGSRPSWGVTFRLAYLPKRCLAVPQMRVSNRTEGCALFRVLMSPFEQHKFTSDAMHYNIKDVYIGSIIRQKIDEKHISYAEFARQINCTRTTLYRIFESKSIDMERLITISKALNYDFIREIYAVEDCDVHTAAGPYLMIPFRNGAPDLCHLPQQVRQALLAHLLAE